MSTDYPSQPGFVSQFAAGAFAGGLSKTIFAPWERVHMHRATFRAKFERTPYKDGCNDFKYFLSRAVRENGFISLWRGNITNVLRYFPTQGFNFAFKEQFKGNLFPTLNSNAGMSLLANMTCGGMAGCATLCIVYPIDSARVLLAWNAEGETRKQYRGILDVIKDKVKRSPGLRGLYAGMGLSVAGVVPYRATYFGMFDTLQQRNTTTGALRIAVTYLIAQVTAITAIFLSYPFDTVRRRYYMIAIQDEAHGAIPSPDMRSIVQTLLRIGKTEGVGALFKGAGASATRTMGSALVLVFYDMITNRQNP